MKILFFGDVYGKAGRHALLNSLSGLKDEFKPDFIIANAENLADGKGLTEKTLQPILREGVDAVTGGNHLWDRAESLEFIKNQARIIKPLNYPVITPGNPMAILDKDGLKLGIICMCGQIYMPPCDNPFTTLESFLISTREKYPDLPIILDFHAESTSEKRAMGWFADGKLAAVLGTHTHIQTADEEILPQGCAYITDIGMTGSHDSVIGVRKEIIVEKMLSSIPNRYESADKGLQVNAVLVELDDSGRSCRILRIRREIEGDRQ
jgi:metallophosphoesterase (TIGR00282 family)